MEDIVLRNEYKVSQKSVVDCSKPCVIVTVLDFFIVPLSLSCSTYVLISLGGDVM